MLSHSELGSHLLFGNTIAVSNYVVIPQPAGTRPEELARLAKKGVSNDPHDPSNYDPATENRRRITQLRQRCAGP